MLSQLKGARLDTQSDCLPLGGTQKANFLTVNASVYRFQMYFEL